MITTCRGSKGQCRFALTDLTAIKNSIAQSVTDLGLEDIIAKQGAESLLKNKFLKVAIAACPNACTQPQIKDIGIIAGIWPEPVNRGCNACMKCEKICQEGAVKINKNGVQLFSQLCVGCGQCIRQCPRSDTLAGKLMFRIMVGGKLGRHPRLAKELPCKFTPSQAPAMVSKLFSKIAENLRPGENAKNVIDRVGLACITSLKR